MEGIFSGFLKIPELQGQNNCVDLVFCEEKPANIPFFLVIGRHKCFALNSHLYCSKTVVFSAKS